MAHAMLPFANWVKMWKLTVKQTVIGSNWGGGPGGSWFTTNINFHSNADDHICPYFGVNASFFLSFNIFSTYLFHFSPCLGTSGCTLELPLKQNTISTNGGYLSHKLDTRGGAGSLFISNLPSPHWYSSNWNVSTNPSALPGAPRPSPPRIRSLCIHIFIFTTNKSSSPQWSFWEQDPSPRLQISSGMMLHLQRQVWTCLTNLHLLGDFAHGRAEPIYLEWK